MEQCNTRADGTCSSGLFECRAVNVRSASRFERLCHLATACAAKV